MSGPPAGTVAQAVALALDPDRPVVAFIGDRSLLTRATELSVAAEQAIAPIYVAWTDRSLAQIELNTPGSNSGPPAPGCRRCRAFELPMPSAASVSTWTRSMRSATPSSELL